MAQRSLKGDVKVEFTEAASRQGIDSGESVKTLFGKIRKWLSDLKPVAFSGSYADLTNKPNLDGKVSKSGDTMTGQLRLKNSNINRDGEVSSTTTGDAFVTIQDKDNETVATFFAQQVTNGTMRCNTNVFNEKEDGTLVNNYFQVAVDKDGTQTYSVANPTNFRKAIGLGNIGYYGLAGRNTNTTNNPWALVAETTADDNNDIGLTLLFEYTYNPPANTVSFGIGILSVNVRSDANNAFVADRSYVKWLTKTSELNIDDVIVTYNNNTGLIQIWGKSDFAYKAIRVRPLSGGFHDRFDISMWTFTAALNTNLYESYPTGDGITVLTPTCDIQEPLSDYIEINQDEDNHTDIISIGATKQLDIVHNDYYLENEIILKGPNVYHSGSAEIVTAGQRAEISLATGAAEVKLVANTDSSNTPYLYLQSGVTPYISIQPNSNKMQFITDVNGTQKIAIDTNGVHIVSGGTVFEVKSDGVYINGTKIGG